ncbi:MAG: hypothetical protein ACR2QO_17060 [Acidimicrobiales bacterium]
MDLFDIYQHQQIRKTHDRVRLNEDANEHRHRRSRDEILGLHERIDHLLVLNEAIWHLVAERTGLTEQDLREHLAGLDASDGVTDRRRQPKPTVCSCGAKVSPKATCCVFCGLPAPERSPFDAV